MDQQTPQTNFDITPRPNPIINSNLNTSSNMSGNEKTKCCSHKGMLLVIIIIVAIVAVGGYYLGNSTGSIKQLALDKSTQDQAIKEIFSNIMFGGSLSGKITSISPNSIIVEVPGVMGVNLPKAYQTKTLLVDSNTRVILVKQKTTEEFNKELLAAQAKSKKDPMGFTPPAPFSQQDITINDLKPDAQISFSIDQSQNKGILDSEYKAVQITITENKTI